MTAMLPRLTHNIRLASEWKAAHPLPPEIPAVVRQLPTVEAKGLFPFGYNPSIIRFGERVLMAYRWHEKGTWETSLAMAELDFKGVVTANKKISLPGPANDDPRLFEHNGGLWVAYVHATAMGKTTIRYGRLIEGNSWSVEGQTLVKYGQNDGSAMEKNWVPFSFRKRIHFIYSCDREQVVIEVEDAEVISEHKGTGARWMWGACRGGTPPLPYQGKNLRFFHSRLNNQGNPAHRYYVGAMLMEPEPPFSVVAVSKKPILRGSVEDSLPDKSKCPCYNPNVVFPLGVIPMKDGWLLSVGINHGACGLVKVKEGDLRL